MAEVRLKGGGIDFGGSFERAVMLALAVESRQMPGRAPELTG